MEKLFEDLGPGDRFVGPSDLRGMKITLSDEEGALLDMPYPFVRLDDFSIDTWFANVVVTVEDPA
jgi:hypothetical protein